MNALVVIRTREIGLNDRRFLLLSFLLVSAACGPESSADRLELSIDPGEGAVSVDTRCRVDCSDGKLGIGISYPDSNYRVDDQIVLLQYRVDYDVPGVKGEIPFFASPLELTLAPNDVEIMQLAVAGSEQRAFVRKALGDKTVLGTATLQFAGYDWSDDRVFLDTRFSVRFGAGDGASPEPSDDEDGGQSE